MADGLARAGRLGYRAHMTDDEHRYRRGVGVMLLNAAGLVFVGRRIDNPSDAWQMPQGGIDEGEAPWPAALRELEEETGIAPHLVERIAACPERLRYELPAELAPKFWGGRWIGQSQDWFLCRFLGQDSDIELATEHPEFSHWQWVEPAALPGLIVPFKRALYEAVLERFAEHL